MVHHAVLVFAGRGRVSYVLECISSNRRNRRWRKGLFASEVREFIHWYKDESPEVLRIAQGQIVFT